ncbi:MAG: DUF3037 domain-containing protein [Tannerellaceae bacterium]|nr:DUF3037 domain-containing protein [Tannerellaceae bacterium]
MQKKYLYEYAVIRLVPRVEREEFFNVGLILFSKEARFIKAKVYLDEEKWQAFRCELNKDWVTEHLKSFEEIAAGRAMAHTNIARMEIPERFRWLTAIRSASIQTSRPHPGFSGHLEETFNKLFHELVR